MSYTSSVYDTASIATATTTTPTAVTTPFVPIHTRTTVGNFENAVIHSPEHDIGRPVHRVSDNHAAMIPEARGLTWNDGFFDDFDRDDGIIAVFDFDRAAIESYYSQLGCCAFGLTLLSQPLFLLSLISLVPCFLQANVKWWAHAKHVAVCEDGVWFVRDQHKRCWGLPALNSKRQATLVRYRDMDGCLVEEAAGSTCCFIVNVLHKVKLQAHNSTTNNSNLLQLVGLKDPRAFQRLVMAMKAQQQQAATLQRNTALVHNNNNNDNNNNNNNNNSRQEGISGGEGAVMTDRNPAEVQTLLQDIRNELREHNQLYQSARANQYALDQNIQQEAHQIVAQADGVHNAFVTATPANSANTPWGRDGEVVMAEARVVQNEGMGTIDGSSAYYEEEEDDSQTNAAGDGDDDDQTLLSYPTVSTLTFQP